MNGELRKAIDVRNMLKRKYDQYKNTENWIKYRNHRNLITRLRKKKHEQFIFTTNVATFWDFGTL